MNLEFSDKEVMFREEVREFVTRELDPSIKHKVDNGLYLQKEDHLCWQGALYKQGWMAPNWPESFGGTGWNPIQRYVFDEECAMGGAPPVVPFGVKMVAPVIMKYGTDEQKAHYLPRILSSEDWWCQGYSEPNAGSDLASLKTSAVPRGSSYIVNGTKIWTTYAHCADMMFCLVRTDPSEKLQQGISFLLIDMRTPGITVRPITTFDGRRDINEVIFEDVVVPIENLVGDEGRGWDCAKSLLSHERIGITKVAQSKRQIARLKQISATEEIDGNLLKHDALFRRKLASIEIDLMALEYTELRLLSDLSKGRTPGPESSLLKIRGTEIQQKITELLVESVGYYAQPYLPEVLYEGREDCVVGPEYAPGLAPYYFNWRKASITGGTNEIQRNIIAKKILDM